MRKSSSCYSRVSSKLDDAYGDSLDVMTVEDEEIRCLRRNNALFIISGEFDNKLGPIVRHQYPRCIPGFKSSLHGASDIDDSINLGSLMIPNNVEYTPGKKDFTVFMLYFNKFTNSYQLFQPTEHEVNAINPIDLSMREEDEFEDARDTHNVDDVDKLFFINVVNTIIDKNNDRGAIIRSIALGMTLKIFNVFGPLLSKILDMYMNEKSCSLQVMIECFDMVNSVDLSFINKVHSRKSLQRTLQSCNEDDIKALLSHDSNDFRVFNRIFKLNLKLKKDCFGNKITIDENHIQYHFTNFESKLLSDEVINTNLRIPLLESDLIGLHTPNNKSLLKFLSKFIPYIFKLPRQKFSWKLIINSTAFSKHELCNFILIISNLISSFFDSEHNKYYKENPIMVFPYMDISLLDSLKIHLINMSKSRSNVFAIIGVANPIFQYQQNTWDCYYDLDNEILYDSPELMDKDKSDMNLLSKSSLKSGSRSFRKILLKPADVITNGSRHTNFRMGFLMKCISSMLSEKTNCSLSTISCIFKKLNLLQLIALLQNSKFKTRSNEMSLIDEYLITYRDLIVFPEFFDYSSLHAISLLISLHGSIETLYSNEALPAFAINSILTKVVDTQVSIFSHISSNRKNLENFLNILLCFPQLKYFENYDMKKYDFYNTDLDKLFSTTSQTNIFSNLTGRTQVQNIAWVERFRNITGFILIAIPLLFDPDCNSNIDMFTNIKRFPLKSLLSNTNGKGKLSRSLSFKKLFPVNSNSTGGSQFSHNSDTSQKTVNESFTNSFRSSFSDPIIYSTPPKLVSDTSTCSNGDHNFKTSFKSSINRSRKLAVKIVHTIHKHPMGEIIFNKYTNHKITSCYNNVKTEFYGRKPSNNLHHSYQTNHNSDPKSDKVAPLSNNRNQLLKELTLISERQEEYGILNTSKVS